MKYVILGLGSNKTFHDMSCIELLHCACHELESILDDIKFSSVYQTKAMYVTNQCDFYNMVVSGYVLNETDPFDLLNQINTIEAKFGRDRSKEIRFGPRSLDIDIEIFGEEIIKTEKLTVPHERLKERAFVLVPMLEILNKSADDNRRDIVKKWLDDLSDEDKNLQIIESSYKFKVS